MKSVGKNKKNKLKFTILLIFASNVSAVDHINCILNKKLDAICDQDNQTLEFNLSSSDDGEPFLDNENLKGTLLDSIYDFTDTGPAALYSNSDKNFKYSQSSIKISQKNDKSIDSLREDVFLQYINKACNSITCFEKSIPNLSPIKSKKKKESLLLENNSNDNIINVSVEKKTNILYPKNNTVKQKYIKLENISNKLKNTDGKSINFKQENSKLLLENSKLYFILKGKEELVNDYIDQIFKIQLENHSLKEVIEKKQNKINELIEKNDMLNSALQLCQNFQSEKEAPIEKQDDPQKIDESCDIEPDNEENLKKNVIQHILRKNFLHNKNNEKICQSENLISDDLQAIIIPKTLTIKSHSHFKNLQK